MKTIILIANDDEAKHLKNLECNICKIIITGEGRSNVIKSLAEKIKDGTIEITDRIINVGYVGGCGFNKGDIVYVNEVQHFIPSVTIKELPIQFNYLTRFIPAKCFTADNFVDSESVGPWMPEKYVCDMELYYIALMFPNVISYKIVSDELNYAQYTEASFKESWIKVEEYIKENL